MEEIDRDIEQKGKRVTKKESDKNEHNNERKSEKQQRNFESKQ